MWQLVCGDAAVEGVSFVLGQALAADSLRVLRDDLAVGPLVDIDRPPGSQRATFWQALWPERVQPLPDFTGTLGDDAQWLAGLARQTRPVTVWHGDSASEQLLLARVAAALEHSELPLWEVPCGSGDSRVETRRAVSMHAPVALRELYLPQRVEPARRQRLAGQWQVALEENAAIRRWRNGAFHGEGYAVIDASLLSASGPDWQPLGWVLAQVMRRCDGFFASDYFLWWRARELAVAGRLELERAPATSYAEQRVRLAQA
ncbi:MAG: DUF3658 domain-containing protein [Pseudomonas sp.]